MSESVFQPKFTMTSSILGMLELLDRQRWLVEHMLLMPKHQAWIQRKVWAARVAATTAIEGEGIGTHAVDQMVKHGASGKLDDAEQANLNALRAYEFVDYLSDQADVPIDELPIRELNRVFMHGASPTLTPGVYRRGQNQVGGYTSPNAGDVPDLMRAFARWLRDDPGDELHPAVRAGIAHIHTVAVHPFWDGNGRTARALMTLVLQRHGFGFKKLLSVESTFASIRDQYIDAIERTLGAAFTADYDATPWLEFFVPALYTSAMELTRRLTEWHRMMEEFHEDFQGLGLVERQVDGLAFAIHTGQITRSDYLEITRVSPVTATRDLNRLVALGFLEVRGRTRNRSYVFRRPATENTVAAEQLPFGLPN